MGMKVGSKIKRWTRETAQIEALKYNTRGKFYSGNLSAYRFANRHGFLDDMCSHMEAVFTYWTEESILVESLKYQTRVDFQKKSSKAYNAALRQGLMEKVCSHMPINMTYWTQESLHSEALKYKTRKEFEIGSCSAYSTAQKRGLLDLICGHMIDVLRYWTNDDIHAEALKRTTRMEFIRSSKTAYAIALTRGIVDQVCSHMKPSRCTSAAEREIFTAVKSIYPNTKKVRDMKVSIYGKPYIHGFDIDIFVPELNRGIEFDGKHHHTFEFMRADPRKSKWSDEDIRNYHDLKDTWFMSSKGVRILHIKEKEWNNNRAYCISLIEQFLGITGFMSGTESKVA